MFRPLISIVIPVYNGGNFLKEAIDSALNQTYLEYEVIVVNDGSCDGGKTQRIIDSYGKRIRGLRKENGGVATALNLAIKNMRGEYFAWLSHDDVLKPKALECYVKYLQHIEKTTILYGNYDLIDEKSQIYNFVNFLNRYTENELENSVFPVIQGCVNGCACLVHKSHFQRVGMFNEKLKITQDNDMWFRIFRNQKIKFVKEMLCSKRYHNQQDSVTKNVYPDEDKFIVDSLKKLTLEECNGFQKSSCGFFIMMKRRFSDGQHPLTEEYCKEMMEEACKEEVYQQFSKEELIHLLVENNMAYKELEEKYDNIQKKYMMHLMG